MQSGLQETLECYEKHLRFTGFSSYDADVRRRKMLEISQFLRHSGDQWVRALFSSYDLCITNSLLSITNVVESI